MQDLEIKGTGNSRFLKSSVPATTTWEDFLTMLRAGNLPIDLTGLNSAGIITQNPSAYNKANVLPDDVCDALAVDRENGEVKDAFLSISSILRTGLRLIYKNAVAGSYTWTAPDLFGNSNPYNIYVEVIGAGGGGGAAQYYNTGSYQRSCYAAGGGSGHARFLIITVTPGQVYNLVVGAGGEGGLVQRKTGVGEDTGGNGGSSSFDGYTAHGGDGGKGSGASGSGGSDGVEGANGGQGSPSPRSARSIYAYGGTLSFWYHTTYVFPSGESTPSECISPFTGEILLCAGGNARTYAKVGYAEIADDIFPYGSPGVAKYNIGAIAAKGTAPGCGGGAAAVEKSSSAIMTIQAANGADGAVKIYVDGWGGEE